MRNLAASSTAKSHASQAIALAPASPRFNVFAANAKLALTYDPTPTVGLSVMYHKKAKFQVSNIC